MALYEDFVKMSCDIRAHVLQYGHLVVPSDNPVERTVGYTCMGCRNGVNCSPQTVAWDVGVEVLENMGVSTIFGISVPGLLKDRSVRGQLTRYLNGISKIELEEPRLPVVDRYHRQWLI